jgi:hypothetical protein
MFHERQEISSPAGRQTAYRRKLLHRISEMSEATMEQAFVFELGRHRMHGEFVEKTSCKLSIWKIMEIGR